MPSNPWQLYWSVSSYQQVSNWIGMSCQPHSVTSGQSNSGHKHIHISKLSLSPTFVKTVHKTNQWANSKQNIHTQISGTHFRRVNPFHITYPVKRAPKARTCWDRQPFQLLMKLENMKTSFKGYLYAEKLCVKEWSKPCSLRL